jgi:MFS family permease
MAIKTARRATRISLPLLGAFVIGAIAYGGLYTFPALSVAFARDFGISRSLAVTPWTMFLIVTAISSPLLGRAYDEFADRDLLTAAMVLNAGGWLAVYLAPDISIVILAYAALHAMGLQLAFIGTTTAIARRYAGISGLALGLTYAGPGVGVAIALPLAAGIIASAGWRATALVFLAASLVGVAFVYLMTAGPAVLVPARREERPADRPPTDGSPAEHPVPHGLPGPRSAAAVRTRETESQQAVRAFGLHETAAPGAVSAAFEPLPVGSRDRRHSVRRTVRTRRFWALFVGAVAIGAFDEGVLQAFLPNAIGAGIGAGTAAVALGLQSVAYVVGQVLGGYLSDRIGRRPVGIVSAVVVLLGVVAAIGLAPVAPAFAVAGIIAHGVGTGATIAVVPRRLRRPELRDDLRAARSRLSGRRHDLGVRRGHRRRPARVVSRGGPGPGYRRGHLGGRPVGRRTPPPEAAGITRRPLTRTLRTSTLAYLARLEVERRRVDAVAQPGRSRPIREEVPEMGAT